MGGSLIDALADLSESEALEITKKRLESKQDPNTILADCQRGMELVGERFAAGRYFLPDLIYSGEIFRQITDIIKPELSKKTDRKRIGKFILGTVAGDIHDIGKDIVGFMMDVNGFEVYDLGVDVPADKFVEKIKEVKPQIVGLSGFLTLAFDSMKETIEQIKAAGLRDSVKIMIGGGQITEDIKDYTGADAYGKDAVEGVALARKWIAAN